MLGMDELPGQLAMLQWVTANANTTSSAHAN
jgi:hypothetical protein